MGIGDAARSNYLDSTTIGPTPAIDTELQKSAPTRSIPSQNASCITLPDALPPQIVDILLQYLDQLQITYQRLFVALAIGIEQLLIDPVTTLVPRIVGELSLARAIERTKRGAGPLSVVCIDIDMFSRFNTQFGHAGGDAALRAVGGVLRSAVRHADEAVRWGVGDELLVILPGVDLDGARVTAERIREAAAELRLEVGRLTISVGIAQWTDGDDVNLLVAKADAALYEAKRSGKNRVVG